MKTKVGILGGTFDPIHKGHVAIAKAAYEEYGLAFVLLIPTGHSPHKSDASITAPLHRLAMVQLATEEEEEEGLRASSFEIEKGKTSYTYETLEELHRLHPDWELYFLMGGDSLRDFFTWKNPDRILESATILCALRDDFSKEAFQKQVDKLLEAYPYAKIKAISLPLMDISSSEIRRAIAAGKEIGEVVPKKVAAYIKENHLYSAK